VSATAASPDRLALTLGANSIRQRASLARRADAILALAETAPLQFAEEAGELVRIEAAFDALAVDDDLAEQLLVMQTFTTAHTALQRAGADPYHERI
jgi:hypothetical protein